VSYTGKMLCKKDFSGLAPSTRKFLNCGMCPAGLGSSIYISDAIYCSCYNQKFKEELQNK